MEKPTGVIYWKHNPGTTDYKGDSQKPGGLCGTDLDSNAYFLRGMDIESVGYRGNDVIITRLNGEEIKFSPVLNGKYSLKFEGTTLSIVNNEDEDDKISVDGVSPSGDWLDSVLHDDTLKGDGKNEVLSVNVEMLPVNVYWDETMTGNGTPESPIGIAHNHKTGFFRPVEIITTVDNLSDYEESGKRVLSIEDKNTYGLLYTKSMMEKVKTDVLSGSVWRLPKKEDFEEYFRHFETTFDMKAVEGWPNGGSNASGIELLPTDDYDGAGVLSQAVIWIDDPEHTVVAIGRTDGTNVVYDTTTESLAGIRLVRDNAPGVIVGETQEINGELFQCCVVGGTVWTTANVNFNNNGITGVTIDGSQNRKKYYICEFDGNIWQKKELGEGDSVVVKSYGGASGHTWRVLDGVLVDVNEKDRSEIVGKIDDDASKNTIYGVKAYVDDAIDNINLSITGDGFIEGSSSGRTVDIKLTDSAKESLAKADNALQQVKEGTYIKVSEKINGEQTIDAEVVDPMVGGEKLVSAEGVKNYVEGKANELNTKINAISGVTSSQKIVPGNDSIEVRQTESGTVLSVKISDDEGNILKLDTNDGLYVKPTDLLNYEFGDGFATNGKNIDIRLDGASLVKSESGLRCSLKLVPVPSSSITNDEIREAWKLEDEAGNVYGSTINVYKDSRFLDAILGHVGGSVTGTATAAGYPYTDGTSAIRALQFIFTTKEGQYSMKEVSLDGYLTVDNIGKGLPTRRDDVSGLTVIDVAVDSNSEKFLSVTSGGIKLSGVGDSITQAAAKASNTVELEPEHPHLTISERTDSDGHRIFTIGESNIADKDGVYTKNDIDNIITSITSTMYSVGMSASPSVVFKDETNQITLSTSFKAFSGNVTPSSIEYYDDAARTSVVSSVVSLTLSDSTSMTYYSKVMKDTLVFMSSATVKAYDKIFYGFGTSAQNVVSAGVFASARATASGTYTATNTASSTNKFYICVPAGVGLPNGFTMNGFGASLNKTSGVSIGGIVYTVYETDIIGANQTVKIAVN